jgi:hypothetical protein
MAFQATATLLGLTGFVALVALLCALVVMLWAIGTRSIPSALAEELKLDPFDKDSSTPLPRAQRHDQAGSTHLDLGIDFESFQSQIRHDFEAFQAQIGRRCDLTFQDLSIDFEAFQAQIGRWCDLELDALCDRELDAMHGPSTKAMQDPMDKSGRGPAGAQAESQPASAEPGAELEAELEADFELLCGRALEGTCGHAFDEIDGALDCMCAAALRALEDECGGSRALA